MNYEQRSLLRYSTTVFLIAFTLQAAMAEEKTTAGASSRRATVAAGNHQGDISQAQPTNGASSLVLPPLPEGVTELKFGDFYKKPIGPFGLEFNDKLRSA